MGLRTWIYEHISKKFLLVAFIHWYLTFFFEKNFFIHSTLESKTFTVAKIIVIFSFWQIVAYMVKRYKSEPDYRRFIHFAAGYFVFSMMLLLLVWPGNWVWDDLNLLSSVHNMKVNAWLGALASDFYFYALLLLPSPISVTILQLFCISLIVGYFVNTLYLLLHRSKIALAGYIPFLFPPALVFNLLPVRATLFAYIFLFFITRLIYLKIKKEKTACSEILFLALLAALIARIRGEGIYMIVYAPFLFICLFWDLSSRLQKVNFAFLVAAFAIILNIQQNLLMSDREQRTYDLTAIIEPLGALVNRAKTEQPSLLSELDNYLDASQFSQELSGTDALWQRPGLVKDAFYENGISPVFVQYLKLIREYPETFLRERWNTYKNSVWPWISIPAVGQDAPQHYELMFSNDPLSRYFSQPTRAKILGYLNLDKQPYLRPFFWNILIPAAFLFIVIITLIMMGKYSIAMTVASTVPAIAMVIIATPRTNFQYHFLDYLTGYSIFFGSLTIALNKLISKGKPERNK